MSTTALQIIELVKSLPAEEQRAICDELSRHATSLGQTEPLPFQRTADGGYYNPDGIPNDHPIFKILEEIEEERHRDLGPPPPDFD